MKKYSLTKSVLLLSLLSLSAIVSAQEKWNSKFIQLDKNSSLQYVPDDKGNTIPDFSRVGYLANRKPIPEIPVVKVISPSGSDDQEIIQAAIDALSKTAVNSDGFRGAILLKKGIYHISGTLNISQSGIVLRGEGEETKLIAVGKGKRDLLKISGTGSLTEIAGTRRQITDSYVPVGTKSFNVSSAAGLKAGDKIVVYRKGTAKWLADLKMDQIEAGENKNLKQWTPAHYSISFEREIKSVGKNRITIDNPIVMAMEDQYGGGEILRYSYTGRISNVGIENLICESEFKDNGDEDHGWNAIHFDRVENSWVRNITARYFGYSAVNLGRESKYITVDNCKSLEPKSIITGGRRYSFNNDGQMNLVMNCFASEGRHDFVTGEKVRGPNVFYNCVAEKAKADIGPHHRWAMGTLYDNIVTDGEINIQDRGNWGTGHGWAGVNQVLWNCTVSKAAVQNPWVSGNNYVIGLKGRKVEGRLKGRPEAIWEGQSIGGLRPQSLYLQQVKESLLTTKIN